MSNINFTSVRELASLTRGAEGLLQRAGIPIVEGHSLDTDANSQLNGDMTSFISPPGLDT